MVDHVLSVGLEISTKAEPASPPEKSGDTPLCRSPRRNAAAGVPRNSSGAAFRSRAPGGLGIDRRHKIRDPLPDRGNMTNEQGDTHGVYDSR